MNDKGNFKFRARSCNKTKICKSSVVKEETLSGWEEYIGDLFDGRGERPEIDKEMDGPPVSKNETQESIKSYPL